MTTDQTPSKQVESILSKLGEPVYRNENTISMKLPTSSVPGATVTILGLGSLLSERSSRTTFPDLVDFRLGRISNRYRRVFGHPASIFFQRGLANIETKEFSSLSAEEFVPEDPDAKYQGGFICSVFEVPREQVYKDAEGSDGEIVTKPTGAFLEREEEFDIVEVPYMEISEIDGTAKGFPLEAKKGTLCTRYTDEGFVERWGQRRFEENYGKYNIRTIWGWEPDSGLLPCRVYLRHCYLAAQSMGPKCFDSFLDETFLVDRTTTIREYIHQNPGLIENTIPPPGFEERYSG